MSKERLKDTIQVLVNSHHRYLNSESAANSSKYYKNYIDYTELIIELFQKKAERVQELETYVETGTYINRKLRKQNKRYRETVKNIKKTAEDYRDGHLLDIQDTFFVDEIIAIINNLEESE